MRSTKPQMIVTRWISNASSTTHYAFGARLHVVLDNIEYNGNGEADPGNVRGNGGYEASPSRAQPWAGTRT